MERENIFDKEFCRKLKAYYSFDEGQRINGDIGYRRTGRTTVTAKILLETAIESGRMIMLQDHYVGADGYKRVVDSLRRAIESEVHYWENNGVFIDLNMSRYGESFSAKLRDGADIYNQKRYSTFPIRELRLQLEKTEFLTKRLLLLL